MAAVRLPGWGATDVLALLGLFRKHLLHYLYTSDSKFAEVVRAEMPDKSAAEIQEMVRQQMMQFGLVLSTKNFRTDVIVTNGLEVYVYEHIHESIRQLPENRTGGVWLPDELSRFLQKAKQYRKLFTKSQEVYFQRVQVWGKSVAESKSKFYALRELYIREKRRSRQRTNVEIARFELLKEIFAEVPPAHREEKLAGVPSKTSKLWSPQDMETLLDFLVRITSEIQQSGSSDLVNQVAETLHRTDQSCVNKLSDMREKFLKKSTSVRAANLPSIVFDPTSEVHKIFSADWTDINDPYALGYFAIKSRCLRLLSVRNKKRRGKSIWSPRPKLRSATISTRKVNTEASPQSAVSVGVSRRASEATQSSNISSALPEHDYAAFVRDVAVQCQWTENVVHNVLRCMQHSIHLYRTNKLVEFFTRIASLTPGVTFQDLFVDAQHILTEFEKRFGTLDGFESLVLTAPGIDSSMVEGSEQANRQGHTVDLKDPANTRFTPTPVLPSSTVKADEDESKHQDRAIDCVSGADLTSDDTRVELLAEDANVHFNSEEVATENDKGCYEQTSSLGSPAQTPQTGIEDTAIDKDGSDHGQSPAFGSPAQTPQTGNEDAADEHSSSTAEKQYSPEEDVWYDRAEDDADLDDDGVDNQSVGSSDNAWSGSSNISDTKDSHHSKDSLSINSQLPLVRQFASGSSKKPSKRGKDEQYGKSFALGKKRRLDEKKSPVTNDEEEVEDGDDEGYDEGEDDDGDDNDDLSEDIDDEVAGDIDSTTSDGEQDNFPHPLQSILDSLDLHITELQEKQRQLIERKEDREWRERQYADRKCGINQCMQPFTFKR